MSRLPPFTIAGLFVAAIRRVLRRDIGFGQSSRDSAGGTFKPRWSLPLTVQPIMLFFICWTAKTHCPFKQSPAVDPFCSFPFDFRAPQSPERAVKRLFPFRFIF